MYIFLFILIDLLTMKGQRRLPHTSVRHSASSTCVVSSVIFESFRYRIPSLTIVLAHHGVLFILFSFRFFLLDPLRSFAFHGGNDTGNV